MDPDEFLRDPRFPDRPQTPDFWRLSEAMLSLDGLSNEGDPREAFKDVDYESLFYLATNQIGQMVRLGVPKDATSMVTAMMTGVLLGIRFAKAGGHRE